MLKDCWNF